MAAAPPNAKAAYLPALGTAALRVAAVIVQFKENAGGGTPYIRVQIYAGEI